LIKNCPSGYTPVFLLANFPQKFDAFDDALLAIWIQKLPVRLYTSFSCSQTFHKGLMVPLALCIQKLVSNPKGSFYSIFCEKIV